MMKLIKYVSSFIIIVSFGILYDKYKSKYLPDEELAQIDLVNKHLLGDNGYNSKRPILWIHTDNEMNARKWITFGSRNTTKNDIPFLELCLNSIVKHCGESFNICLIDDTSYEKLIPQWKIKVNELASPLKENIRLLLTHLIRYSFVPAVSGQVSNKEVNLISLRRSMTKYRSSKMDIHWTLKPLQATIIMK